MKFKTYSTLRSHVKVVHSSDENLKCKHCGKKFRCESSRKSHEAFHEDPKFQCRHCPKKLKTLKNLVSHERYHTGEKPFKCSHCDSGFVRLSGLQQHMKGVHKIEGPQGGKTGWNNSKKKVQESSQ